jgi:hypothetical protein
MRWVMPEVMPEPFGGHSTPLARTRLTELVCNVAEKRGRERRVWLYAPSSPSFFFAMHVFEWPAFQCAAWHFFPQ